MSRLAPYQISAFSHSSCLSVIASILFAQEGIQQILNTSGGVRKGMGAQWLNRNSGGFWTDGICVLSPPRTGGSCLGRKTLQNERNECLRNSVGKHKRTALEEEGITKKKEFQQGMLLGSLNHIRKWEAMVSVSIKPLGISD